MKCMPSTTGCCSYCAARKENIGLHPSQSAFSLSLAYTQELAGPDPREIQAVKIPPGTRLDAAFLGASILCVLRALCGESLSVV